MIRRAPYNYELIIFERWRVPYAPAYGWRHWLTDVIATIVEAVLGHG